jgi:hypothetical protein
MSTFRKTAREAVIFMLLGPVVAAPAVFAFLQRRSVEDVKAEAARAVYAANLASMPRSFRPDNSVLVPLTDGVQLYVTDCSLAHPWVVSSQPPLMPNGDEQFTTVQLKDGTTLQFKGKLTPEQIRAKVAEYRTKIGKQSEQTGQEQYNIKLGGQTYTFKDKPGLTRDQAVQSAINRYPKFAQAYNAWTSKQPSILETGSEAFSQRQAAAPPPKRSAAAPVPIPPGATNGSDCVYFTDQFRDLGGHLLSVPLGDENQVAIEKEYWAAYAKAKSQHRVQNALESVFLSLWGFPCGIIVWLFYRLVRFAVKG